MPANTVIQYPANYSQFQYQFSNIAVSLSTKPDTYFPFFTAISYSDTNDVAEARGISPYSMGSTLGEYKCSVSCDVQKLYVPQFLQLVASGSPNGNSLYDSIFDFTVQYQLTVPFGQQAPPVVTDSLKGCRLMGQGMDMSAGNGVLTTKFQIYCPLIVWGGYLPLAGLPQ